MTKILDIRDVRASVVRARTQGGSILPDLTVGGPGPALTHKKSISKDLNFMTARGVTDAA